MKNSRLQAQEQRSSPSGWHLRPASGHYGREVAQLYTSWGAAKIVEYGKHALIARHDHEDASICFVLRGRHIEATMFRSHDAEVGSLIIHPAGSHHRNEKFPGTKLLIVELASDFVHSLRRDADILSEWRVADGRAVAGPSRLIAGMVLQQASAASLDESLYLLLDQLDHAKQSALPIRRPPAWMQRVTDRLHATDLPAPTASELAELAGVHPVYMARAFRTFFDCTTYQYSHIVRAEAAARAINASSVSIADAAMMTGFADQSHLTRAFTRIFGTSPARYRRLVWRQEVGIVQERRR